MNAPPVRRLLIKAEQPEAAAVRNFILNGHWRHPGQFRRLATRNPRYAVYELHLPAVKTPCILKMARAAPAGYRPARRLTSLVSHLLRDPARRALRGARMLAACGLPTFRPLACWQARSTGWWPDSFLLYASIPARHSLRDYKLGNTGLTPVQNASKLATLAGQFADLVATMHRNGLLHNDLACGNFLVGDDGRLYVIDADHVHRSRLRWFPRLKRFFDLNDLRRLDLDEPLRRAFLARYLGGRDSEFWWRVHLFWRNGGNRPLRWLLRRIPLRRTPFPHQT